LEEYWKYIIQNVAEKDQESKQILLEIAGIYAARLKEYQAAEMITFEHSDFAEVTLNTLARLKVSILRKTPHELDTQSLVHAKIFTDF